jgi:hypothetical protein
LSFQLFFKILGIAFCSAQIELDGAYFAGRVDSIYFCIYAKQCCKQSIIFKPFILSASAFQDLPAAIASLSGFADGTYILLNDILSLYAVASQCFFKV